MPNVNEPLSETDLADLCRQGVVVGGRTYANLGELLDTLCVHGHAPVSRDPADLAHRASLALEISALAAALPQVHGRPGEAAAREALALLVKRLADAAQADAELADADVD